MLLLDALRQRFPDSSNTTLRQFLQSDRVRVNGAPERNAKREVSESDRIEVVARSEKIDPRVRILFEDDDLIVVDKSEGLLTVPSEQMRYETAQTFLEKYLNRELHVVQRLDRDTSGVLVFAKNAWIAERLRELFATHDIDRIYIAIVHGKLKPPAGTFRSLLSEGGDLRVRSGAEGKEAITHYRTIASGRQYSMLEVTLETGRRNQIRVHLSENGHPIVGDTMYGNGRELGRLCLHARLLGFVHPRSGVKVSFSADLPKEFRELAL